MYRENIYITSCILIEKNKYFYFFYFYFFISCYLRYLNMCHYLLLPEISEHVPLSPVNWDIWTCATISSYLRYLNMCHYLLLPEISEHVPLSPVTWDIWTCAHYLLLPEISEHVPLSSVTWDIWTCAHYLLLPEISEHVPTNSCYLRYLNMCHYLLLPEISEHVPLTPVTWDIWTCATISCSCCILILSCAISWSFIFKRSPGSETSVKESKDQEWVSCLENIWQFAHISNKKVYSRLSSDFYIWVRVFILCVFYSRNTKKSFLPCDSRFLTYFT